MLVQIPEEQVHVNSFFRQNPGKNSAPAIPY